MNHMYFTETSLHCHKIRCLPIPCYYAIDPFLYPLKASESFWFSDVFRGDRNRPVVLYRLTYQAICLTQFVFKICRVNNVVAIWLPLFWIYLSFFAARMEVSRSNMHVSFVCISIIYNADHLKSILMVLMAGKYNGRKSRDYILLNEFLRVFHDFNLLRAFYSSNSVSFCFSEQKQASGYMFVCIVAIH